MKIQLLASSALCLSLLIPARAVVPSGDSDYFRIGSVTVSSEESVSDLTDKDFFPAPLRQPVKAVGAGIVNGGIQAWNVINSGRPDANLSSSYASAIPGFSFNWANYSGWKKKETVSVYTVTNHLGLDVIRLKYAVSFYFNGQNPNNARAGNNPETALVGKNSTKGNYITNFTIRPLEMEIKWGWKFSMNVRISDPMNVGPADNPVAYLQSDINCTVSTPFSTKSSVRTLAVNGLGDFRDMTEMQERLSRSLPQLEPAEVPAISWN